MNAHASTDNLVKVALQGDITEAKGLKFQILNQITCNNYPCEEVQTTASFFTAHTLTTISNFIFEEFPS